MEELEWKPDSDDDTQDYVYNSIIDIIEDNVRGEDLQDVFLELLPLEPMFSPNTLGGSNSPLMFKVVRDVIQARGGSIRKRNGHTNQEVPSTLLR